MIKFENTSVSSIVRAVYSARNALNSWDKSDSDWETDTLGEADLSLAKRLINAGSDHRKFLRMVVVWVDIVDAPRFWWTEFDTYKVGTVRNSCSTMHTIHKKPFTEDDFTISIDDTILDKVLFNGMLDELNFLRDTYLRTKDKNVWRSMIELLPQSYNQTATVMLNYEVIRNMYHQRRHHKLTEWHDFCAWVETLPYAKELIIGDEQ